MTYNLEDVSGIGKATADRLRASGIDTVEKLASTSQEEFKKLNIKGVGESTALKYIKNAQSLIKESSSDTEAKSKKEVTPLKPVKSQKPSQTKKEKPKKLEDQTDEKEKKKETDDIKTIQIKKLHALQNELKKMNPYYNENRFKNFKLDASKKGSKTDSSANMNEVERSNYIKFLEQCKDAEIKLLEGKNGKTKK